MTGAKAGPALFLATALMVVACANDSVSIEIKYADVRPSRLVEVEWRQGLTALEALRAVAEVEQTQVGQWAFVTGIDDVVGERGDMGWYYRVNDKAPKKLPHEVLLARGDRMTWIYREDTCSATIDVTATEVPAALEANTVSQP